MARGGVAAVHMSGRTRLLRVTADDRAGKDYAGDGVDVSLSFVEDLSDDSGRLIGHKAGAMVKTSSGTEHFYGTWLC